MEKQNYSPATCEHKLPNGFGAWMFHSGSSGSGPDLYYDVHVSVCRLCGTIRVGGFRQDKAGKLNRFSEELSIHAAEAIDAMIKYANYIHGEEVWGRVQPGRGDGMMKATDTVTIKMVNLETYKKELTILKSKTGAYENALVELVELKHLKETKGKTEDYEKRQPIAWRNAESVLLEWDGKALSEETPVAPAPSVDIQPSLKFNSSHLPDHSFEVINVAPGNNKLTVRITSPGGDRWTEPDWNLHHTQWAFEKGEYKKEAE